MKKYNPKSIEPKWQKYWEKKKVFVASAKSKKKKKYVLVEFPYPSGAGLHMGHLRPYVAGDVYSRYQRLRGYEVLYPMGWDAFGLPAENYAIKHGVQPAVSTAANIKNAKRQVNSWGVGFDWSREIDTTDPEYYKWTQWIFLEFFKKGFAYEATGPINWCPKDKTGLANEEVIDGKCERCGTFVEKKNLRQWYLKITAYADKLLQGLKDLPEWPDRVKVQQENWIGKSQGLEEYWQVEGMDLKLSTFTTWPHTSWGTTFMVIAPEHPVVDALVAGTKYEAGARKFIQKYLQDKIKNPLNIEKSKDGFFLGRYVINHLTGWKMPLYVANFAILDYGTGIVKCTPAHDQRDFEFAKKFNLPVKPIVAEETGIVRTNEQRRDGGCGVIFDPGAQKYAVAKSADGIIRLFSGGVEDGESLQQGVIREIAEESGLHDFQHVEELRTAFAHFYNHRKKVNRSALATCFLVVLQSNVKKRRKLESHEKDLILSWLTPEEILENWRGNNEGGGMDHWITFLGNAVSMAIELGFDTTSNPANYVQSAYTGEGIMINAGQFTGMKSQDARNAIADYTISQGSGRYVTNYKLRDWLFSRQRYWGEPIPLIHCGNCGIVPVPEKDLPVKLPKVKKYEPTGTGESPLAAIKKWVNTRCPKCKSFAKRETNTMPQWAGSSWYWLRYADPKNKKVFADRKLLKRFTPVDIYFGGMEHTTLHLLYSRFWNLFLYDQKYVTTKEPYVKRVPHGIILGPDGEKMSKSRGNVVNPDTIVKQYGADTLRMYELFLGPHEAMVKWDDKGVIGVKRFLDRVWHLVSESSKQKAVSRKDSEKVDRAINRLIKKVGEDIENCRFNTSVSAFMEFINTVKDEPVSVETVKKFLVLLHPFAPHITEELHQALGGKETLQLESWPMFNPKKIIDEMVKIVIQVNGKTKDTVSASPTATEAEVVQVVIALEKIRSYIAENQVKKIIYVPGRIINLVV